MYNNSFKEFFTGIGGYILVILLVAYSFFVIVAKCNRPKTKDAPETVSKAQYDQAMQVNSELTKRLADDSVRSNMIVRMQRDSIQSLRVENSALKTKLIQVNQKKKDVKTSVDNLSVDSLASEFANF